MTFEPMKYHQRPRSSWLSLLHILHIDLLAYTSLFSVCRSSNFLYIDLKETREFDLSFASQRFYCLLNQLVFLYVLVTKMLYSKTSIRFVRGLESIFCDRAEFILSGFDKRYLQKFLATVSFEACSVLDHSCLFVCFF